MPYTITRNTIGFYFIAIICFVVSYVLLNFYVNGDQVSYHLFYNKIANLSFFDVGTVALGTISSYEPLSWLFLWLGSYLGIDKNIWISILNFFLITGLYFLCIKHEARWWIIGMVLTNFYVIVLCTSAERLKISYILLVWAFVFEGRLRLFLLYLTPLAHLQSIIILCSLFALSVADDIKNFFLHFKVRKKRFLYFLALIFLSSLFYIYLKDGILYKSSKYFDSNIAFIDIFKFSLLMIISLAVTKDKIRLILALFPLLFATALLGSERLNMITVTVVLGLLLYERKIAHPLIFLFLFYFSMKSIPFVYNIFIYGDGFSS